MDHLLSDKSIAADLWEAVLNRDATFDSKFVYGVLSTKIYCRPSCPSRRPKRRNVVFFSSFRGAEESGFRSCLRCHPHGITLETELVQLIEASCRLLEKNPRLSVEALAQRIGFSPAHFSRTFKRLTGLTVSSYARACQMKDFKVAVKKERNVTDALYSVGLGSSRALYERADEELGMRPREYRYGGREVNIAYTLSDSPLGVVLVAMGSRGVCSITLGDDKESLLAGLITEFPAAIITDGTPVLGDTVKQVLSFLSGASTTLNFPLEVRATIFQRRVWEELRKIPYGETRSYSEIARGIGRPKAVRAVANACARNPVALRTPCHRVVRSDGSLSGYRWGVERKKRLLELEGVEKKKREK